MDPMAAIRQTFFQECEEQLAELEAGLLAMENGEADSETVNAVFRAVHSVKGGAGAFSLEDLVGFAHVFETALDHVRAGKLEPSPEVLKVLLRAADVLADLVRAARDGGSIDESRAQKLADELRALNPSAEAEPEDDLSGLEFQPVHAAFDFDEDAPASPSENVFIIKFKPKPSLYAKANEAMLILRELGSLGTVETSCDISELPLLSELDPEGAYLSWTIKLTTPKSEDTVREVFDFVTWDCDLDIVNEAAPQGEPASTADNEVAALLARVLNGLDASPAGDEAPESPVAAPVAVLASALTDDAEPAAAKPAAAAKHAAEAKHATEAETKAVATIRVDLDRVDRLIDLVGELVINQAMLAQRVTEAGLARASNVVIGLDELEQLTREIQDSVMAIRAQPVKSVFQRMPRLVRELAVMTGKAVRLVTDGEGTEVDKTVIERLTDPLTHMIRNAIDHGLEKPEARIVAGKPEEGTVRLSALHRSGRIVIEISDDGAGINRPRVKQIAIDKGLIPADVQLSDEEIDNLIFLPGFSTASEISDISGRGVGMDVVKRSIQALGGRISISSRPGRGSTFTMSLPLTLAVLDGMVVTVADQTLIVPLTAIVETLQPKAGEIHGMGGSARVISIRNKFTPLIDIGRELSYRANVADPMSSVVILVETEGGGRSALLVDAIQGQRQVVIKSLEANYRHVPGIAAATILGDGRVALILDVDAVIANAQAKDLPVEASEAA
ncbi:chemotaxis protein CheA [Methylovirgula ligni]|uniref:Chemotaxis protein CheA n=1 Tax=Methylovirgula ligni TaxID=569860 RepID=A0A3D9Z703_9HYPH|nr:chemotaxis protein CheA [Methylovirgula ligni]QAY95367.1 chemotaxis protein CheA [Methylovirgula ligni]REF89319.1 two-component system chemotaxis sensor kinase CheA [Methylovirgula ligni]